MIPTLLQVKVFIDSQKEKYAEEECLPPDLEESLQELEGLEVQTTAAFQVCGQKMQQARATRQQHTTNLLLLSEQLDKADSALADPKLRAEENNVSSVLFSI